jgi:hypothetical protein
MRLLFLSFALSASAHSSEGGHYKHSHHHPRLSTRQAASGFVLAEKGSLASYKLSSTCEQVVYQTLACDSYVSSLSSPRYHGSLGDNEFTAEVCAPACGTSLANMRRRILGACASTPELFPGYPVLTLVDSVLGGWNETCLKDTTTGKNCNGEWLHQNSPSLVSHTSAQISSTHGLQSMR